MLKILKASDRGNFKNDWLNSYHSFSFDTYHNPEYMQFGPLRVLNHDFVQPDSGFASHPHRDMEIITFVIRGEIQHKDSLGNEMIVGEGEVQRMTAGSGITHSEWNANPSKTLELFQIWILPSTKGLEPGYEQKHLIFSENRWTEIANSNGEFGALKIHQDVELKAMRLSAVGSGYKIAVRPNRKYWLQMIEGSMRVNETLLESYDGIQIEEEEALTLNAQKETEFLFFDLPR